MKEEEPNWFSRWEEDLPSPEELTPLSQTLITPDLALAFDIPGYATSTRPNNHHQHQLHPTKPTAPTTASSPSQSQNPNSQAHPDPLDSSEVGGGGDEQARTLKRPRLVWTPQLHKRFVDAVAHLGIKNAVPKTIMQLMSVDGLTRENVASHLQKYRLYLKRMQGVSSPGGPHAPAGSAGPHHDAATEQLFATGPLPHHFLHHHRPTPAPADPFSPFASLQHQQQHRHHMAALQHQQYYHNPPQRGLGHVGSAPGAGFDHVSYAASRQVAVQQRVVGAQPSPPFGEEYEQGRPGGGGERKVLTLFPTND